MLRVPYGLQCRITGPNAYYYRKPINNVKTYILDCNLKPVARDKVSYTWKLALQRLSQT